MSVCREVWSAGNLHDCSCSEPNLVLDQIGPPTHAGSCTPSLPMARLTRMLERRTLAVLHHSHAPVQPLEAALARTHIPFVIISTDASDEGSSRSGACVAACTRLVS